jgi:hypothetical protein
MGAGQYPESARTERAVEAARLQLMDSLKRQNQERRQADLKTRTAWSRQEFDDFARAMGQREQQLEMRLREQLQQLRERQAREYAEHDAEWTVEPKQRQFNRSSQKVRVLRLQRQLLGTSHRFEEALQVSEIGDAVAQKETIEHHAQMQTEFEASRVLLDKKHADEMDTLLQAHEVRRGEFRFIRETLARGFTHRFAALKSEKETANDPDKLWVRTRKNDGLQIASMYGPKRKITLSKIANVAEFNTLALPPLEMESVVRKRNLFSMLK